MSGINYSVTTVCVTKFCCVRITPVYHLESDQDLIFQDVSLIETSILFYSTRPTNIYLAL